MLSLTDRKKRSIDKLKALLPFLQPLSVDLLRFGYQILSYYFLDRYMIEVVDTLRNQSRQEKYLKEGKTKAPYGYSFHNYGLAFDLAIYDQEENKYNYDDIHSDRLNVDVKPLSILGDKWEKHFLGKWGGNFTSIKDEPHFEYSGNMPVSEVKEFVKKNTLFDLDSKMRETYFVNTYL